MKHREIRVGWRFLFCGDAFISLHRMTGTKSMGQLICCKVYAKLHFQKHLELNNGKPRVIKVTKSTTKFDESALKLHLLFCPLLSGRRALYFNHWTKHIER